MKYMLTIFNDPEFWESITPETMATIAAGHRTFQDTLIARGIGFSGEALEPPIAATALRREPAGAWIVTDGPFVETREIIGGYYVYEANDLDDALALAKLVPASAGIDLRPVKVMQP